MATTKDRIRRLRLIKRLEAARTSDVIVYITGDRPAPVFAQLSEEAIRPLYDHILSLSLPKRQRRLGYVPLQPRRWCGGALAHRLDG